MIRLLTPLLIFFFGIVISIYSYITYADFAVYGAAFYPTIVGALVALFALFDFLMEFRIRRNAQRTNRSLDIKVIAMITGVVLFYIFTVEYLGFIVTVSLILLIFTLPLIKKQRFATSVFLVLLAVGIYLLFAKVLLVPLPDGMLFE